MSIEKYTKDNKTFEINYDEFSEKPELRCHIFHWHKNMELGKRIAPDGGEITAMIESKDWGLILELYIYQHSGIKLSLAPFGCKFDSGQVGYVGITREEMMRDYNGNAKEARKAIENDLDIFTAYCNGEVYRWTVEAAEYCHECGHPIEKEPEGDCGGYYGGDSFDQMKADAGVDETWEKEE